MRAARLASVAALALAAGAGAEPREVIDDCARNAPESAVGLAALEAACPGLGAALGDIGVAALLSEASRKQLTAATLAAAVNAGTATPSADAKRPGTASLAPILQSLVERNVEPSWWERLKDWLRRHLIGDASSPAPDWLRNWLLNATPSQRILAVIFNALKVLVVCGALAIIVRELRASGLLRARARPHFPKLRTSSSSRSQDLQGLAAVEAAPVGVRAALLFQLILRRLAETGRLRAGRSLTHRELRLRPPFADANDGARFARIATVAEEQLFAGSPVAAERVAAALEDGLALYSTLEPMSAAER